MVWRIADRTDSSAPVRWTELKRAWTTIAASREGVVHWSNFGGEFCWIVVGENCLSIDIVVHT